MKELFIIIPLLALTHCGFAQYKENEKLPIRARIVTDSGSLNGYYVDYSDSTFFLSTQNRYISNTSIPIPLNSIKAMRLKNKKVNLGVALGVSVFSFVLSAGLIQNNDYDNDGKTSFWELIIAAIDGTTSKNRQRRNASLIVGTAGGTAALLVTLLALRKFSLRFPLRNRINYFNQKRGELNNYLNF